MPYSPDTLTRIEIGGNLVKKTFMNTGSAAHVCFLSEIYRLLRRKNVPHTDFLRTTSIDSLSPRYPYITTSPVGLDQWPEDGRDAYNAVHCVLEALKVLALPIS